MTSSSISSGVPARKQLVSFALLMAGALTAIAAFRIWRHHFDAIAIALLAIAALFVIGAFVAPTPLAAVYGAWMRLAELLGWLNTRIILILIFYLVVTPIGLIMRALGRSPLDMKKRESYWTGPPRSSYGDRHYEKQF